MAYFRIGLLLFLLPLLSACGVLFVGAAAGAGYAIGKDERSVSVIASDSAIVTSIQTKLVADKYVRGSTVRVSCYEGAVTLRGTVESYIAVDRAEQIARSVSNVVGVDNQLEVEP